MTSLTTSAGKTVRNRSIRADSAGRDLEFQAAPPDSAGGMWVGVVEFPDLAGRNPPKGSFSARPYRRSPPKRS